MAMPVIDYVAPDGRFAARRGIVAGVDVSAKASIGMGISKARLNADGVPPILPSPSGGRSVRPWDFR